MLLFDWKKIFEKTAGNSLAIFLIFKMMTTKQIPLNKRDKIYKYTLTSFVGHSFLVNPDVLLFHAYRYSYSEIAQYLALASLRSLADYKATGTTTLDLFHCDVDIGLYENNRLLLIDEEGRLHFKYEEARMENTH